MSLSVSQLMLLAQIDRAPERLKSLLRQVRLWEHPAYRRGLPPGLPSGEDGGVPHHPGCSGGGMTPGQSEGARPSQRRVR
jgi:hypothetical protein